MYWRFRRKNEANIRKILQVFLMLSATGIKKIQKCLVFSIEWVVSIECIIESMVFSNSL